MKLKLIIFAVLMIGVGAYLFADSDDSSAAVVASGSAGTDLTWEYDDATYTVTISGSGTSMETGRYNWDWIESGSHNAKSIVFNTPNLQQIGEYAFEGFSEATSINLPSTITTIGDNAFWGCTKLNITSLPTNLAHVGWYAFQNCTNLTVTELPSTLLDIEYGAFANSGIKITTLPVGITEIKPHVFSSCESITQMKLPDGLTTIGDNAFFDAYNMVSVEIPSSVTQIEKDAFGFCMNLKTIYYNAENVTSVWEEVPYLSTQTRLNSPFWKCDRLESVYIGEEVQSIPDGLFSNDSFRSTVPSMTLYWDAVNCADFSSENIIFKNSKITTIILGDNVRHVPAHITKQSKTVTSVSFNDGLESIGNYAFYDCADLVVLSLPNSVTTIGAHVFENCGSVGLVRLPQNIQTIGDYAFKGCNCNFKSLPVSLDIIGQHAFENNATLTMLTVPAGFDADIQTKAFYGCTSLKSILNLSDLNIRKNSNYGYIGYYSDNIKTYIEDVAVVQMKDNIVTEVTEKTDSASVVLRAVPVFVALAILIFVFGLLHYRNTKDELN